jgi:Domain of unknown function (DUF4124)
VRRVRLAVLALGFAASAGAFGQTIYKCKGPDGRITYSSQACAGEGAPLTRSAAPSKSPPADAQGAAKAEPVRGPLPKQCDNSAPLKTVVGKLDSPTTHDDVRAFLADERFRLMRCEYTRFTPEERRERDAAIAEVDSTDPARRKAAMERVESIYDRHLTVYDRSARGPGSGK